jgi:hypothetical protein
MERNTIANHRESPKIAPAAATIASDVQYVAMRSLAPTNHRLAPHLRRLAPHLRSLAPHLRSLAPTFASLAPTILGVAPG